MGKNYLNSFVSSKPVCHSGCTPQRDMSPPLRVWRHIIEPTADAASGNFTQDKCPVSDIRVFNSSCSSECMSGLHRLSTQSTLNGKLP